MTAIMHKFEIAGLGKAPFKYVGNYTDVGPRVWEKDGIRYESGAPGQPMGTCDYCGQGIKFCFEIKSADGKKFVVGSDCVMKTHAKGDRVYSAVEQEVLRFKREARHANEKKKIAELREMLKDDAVREVLAGRPHPFKADDASVSLLSYADGGIDNNAWGTAARIRLYRGVKKVLKAAAAKVEAPKVEAPKVEAPKAAKRPVVLDITNTRGSAKKILRENLTGLGALLEGETVWIVDDALLLRGALTEEAVRGVLEDGLGEEENHAPIPAKFKTIRTAPIEVVEIKSPKTGKRGWRVVMG